MKSPEGTNASSCFPLRAPKGYIKHCYYTNYTQKVGHILRIIGILRFSDGIVFLVGVLNFKETINQFFNKTIMSGASVNCRQQSIVGMFNNCYIFILYILSEIRKVRTVRYCWYFYDINITFGIGSRIICVHISIVKIKTLKIKIWHSWF